jgi:alpha-N-arabinofuranosidase
MEGFGSSDGVYAPTIRYHKGKFYVVVSIVQRSPRKIQNILITADSLMQEWSEPIVLTDSSLWAIDPSLLFDDDGRCYFVANRVHQEKQPYSWYREIAVQELDLNDMKLKGRIEVISKGEVRMAHHPEAPHIYKKDSMYYLVIAEGGTGITHSVTITRSKDVFGPYEPCHYNPILTHRHLQKTVPLRCLGHADIVQTHQDEWYMVFLGVRYTDEWSFMGRETYMVPMIWEENSFPVVNPGIGLVQFNYLLPSIADKEKDKSTFSDSFDDHELNNTWTFLRSIGDFYEQKGDGYLKIKLQPATLSELTTPSFIGRRVENHDFEAIVNMKFYTEKENEEAGLVILATEKNFVKLTFGADKLVLTERTNGKNIQHATIDYKKQNNQYLKVVAEKQVLSFYYSQDGNEWKKVKEGLIAKSLARYRFTGNFIGFYATSDGHLSENELIIDKFTYINK